MQTFGIKIGYGVNRNEGQIRMGAPPAKAQSSSCC